MFEEISFKGRFRTYQQRILDDADEYLKDGKIHIVAAPGSGKTILGLELIARLKSPCLILSPTTTIRNQWGDRFCESFLNGENADDYVSYDLKAPKPITSVTYQALHAAVKRRINDEDGEDFSDYDFFAKIENYGIKTICLDEAHHLQNEWQKALELLLDKTQGKVRTIALTATPPYDATPAEWERYTAVCGEIDEEIFVPELVRENSLCPHQDFIYFNYPTAEEAASFTAYRERAATALEELYASRFPETAYENLLERKTDYDFLYTDAEDLICLLTLFKDAGITPKRSLVRRLTPSKQLPRPTPNRLNAAVNYLVKSELLTEAERAECLSIFAKNGVTERGEICLELNEKLKRRLISSTGKLNGISDIVKSEGENRRDKLRMLILTDYIKKDGLALIGSDGKPDAVSVVSVFETVRRTGVRVAALSGSLVILPDDCAQTLKSDGADFTYTPLGDTGYSKYEFKGGNRQKVNLVGKLFESNAFSVLVGTKSLLGEGWDAPCVNSLVLASFVGSFMLSNQMRGRAIRADRAHADKTANIWHLVTIERPHLYKSRTLNRIAATAENRDEINSCDFETIKRRFDCFVAPNYTTGEIENGISRVTVIKPPFDEKGIKRINEQTLKLAAKDDLKPTWDKALDKSTILTKRSNVPEKGKIPPFLFVNLYFAALLISFAGAFIGLFVECAIGNITRDDSTRTAICVIAAILCVGALIILSRLIIHRILKHISPKKSIATLSDCVMLAMQDAELISKDTKLEVDGDSLGIFVHIELKNASVHDQNLFHTAIGQMLSPIQNPRYLLIPRSGLGYYRYNQALACPDILGSKKEYAELLSARLSRSVGKIETVYTRTENGRKLILKCRRNSYISKNEDAIYGNLRLS